MTRKRVKNINLHIKPGGEITVSANSFVPIKAIEDFLILKSEFILKTLERFKALSESAPKNGDLSSGDRVVLCGREYTLSVRQGKNGVFVLDESIVLSVKDPDDKTLKKKVLNGFYKNECVSLLTGICRHYYPLFGGKPDAFPELRFRNMKTRWGVCAPFKNRITFNTRLILLDRRLAEYVVCHELAHFSAPDHSKRFYAVLGAVLPDHRGLEKELKKYILVDFPK